MNSKARRLRLVATGAAFALVTLVTGTLHAQSGWSSAGGNGAYSVTGAGIQGLTSYELALPGGADADSIVVEVIGKGPVVPTTCTFSSAVDAPVALAGESLSALGSGTHLTAVFRHTMAAAPSVTVATDDPAHTWSVIAYVFDADGAELASVGSFTSYYIYLDDWTGSFDLAPAATSRDVAVTVPITDLNGDGRVADITATAGGVSQTISVSDSDLGSRLRVVELILNDVPADATHVDVSVSSPATNGDSFTFGVGVKSRHDGDFRTLCASGESVDIVGQGTYGMPTSTVSIPDPGSVAYVVAEVIHKGTAPVSTCTFSSDVDAPVSVSGTVIPPTGDGTETVTVFRYTLGAASSVTIGTDDPANTQSVVCYVHRNVDGDASTGFYAQTYLLHAEWSHLFPLATTAAPRNVRVTVPITELDGDGRDATVMASAGGVSETVTLDLSTLGASLNVAEVVLPNVPGWASQVYVQVKSANPSGTDPGGDSFVFGVTVSSECSETSTCDAPVFTGTNFITPRSPVVYWEDVPGAIRYEVCGRKAGSSTWRCHTRYVNYKRFFDMEFGQPYELQVRVQCADGSISPYSPIDTLVATAPRMADADAGMEAASTWTVFPNPVVDRLVINRSQADGKAKILVRNILGKVVAQTRAADGESSITLDLSMLPAGRYLVSLEDDNETRTTTISVVR